MDTWMHFRTTTSSETITPPSGEYWILTDLSVLRSGSAYNLSVGGVSVAKREVSATDTQIIGAHKPLSPVFSSTVPLTVTGDSGMILSGVKVTAAEGVPGWVSGLVDSTTRMLVRPPVGKVWRVIGIKSTGSGGALQLSLDGGTTWYGSMPLESARTIRVDRLLWRDQYMRFDLAASSQTVTVLYIEYDEADWLELKQAQGTTLTTSGTSLEIRPPAGEVWKVEGFYIPSSNMAIDLINDGALVTSITSTPERELGPIVVSNSTYIRLRTMITGASLVAYTARKVV